MTRLAWLDIMGLDYVEITATVTDDGRVLVDAETLETMARTFEEAELLGDAEEEAEHAAMIRASAIDPATGLHDVTEAYGGTDQAAQMVPDDEVRPAGLPVPAWIVEQFPAQAEAMR